MYTETGESGVPQAYIRRLLANFIRQQWAFITVIDPDFSFSGSGVREAYRDRADLDGMCGIRTTGPFQDDYTYFNF